MTARATTRLPAPAMLSRAELDDPIETPSSPEVNATDLEHELFGSFDVADAEEHDLFGSFESGESAVGSAVDSEEEECVD